MKKTTSPAARLKHESLRRAARSARVRAGSQCQIAIDQRLPAWDAGSRAGLGPRRAHRRVDLQARKTRNDSWADHGAYRSCALCAFARLRRRFVGNRGADVAGSSRQAAELTAITI